MVTINFTIIAIVIHPISWSYNTRDVVSKFIKSFACTLHADSPISRNPVLVKNTTHVIVSWSPPFLWPGRAIEYYTVSFMLESDGSIYSQRVNSTFSDHVVSYTQQMSGESLSCTSFTFYITAADSSGSILQTFNVTSCKEASHYVVKSLF